jgi:hypothetical protein
MRGGFCARAHEFGRDNTWRRYLRIKNARIGFKITVSL